MDSIPPDKVIRISKEEVTSSHVDDLLKRQMSLRGEPGVTRQRGRKWYYQTWFVMMLVGALGAIAAWALIEPFFADMLYLQGPISAISPGDKLPRDLVETERGYKFRHSVVGSVMIKGERIFLLGGTREIRADGSRRRLDSEALHVGEVIGAYTEYYRGLDDSFALAYFIERSPKPQPPARARLTLDQLHRRSSTAGILLFAAVAGFIGLFIGAADGLICRLPRRALLCGAVGLLVGVVGGFVCSIAANIAYAPLTRLAEATTESGSGLSTFGFVIQMFGRALGWCLAGVAMGLGQGIALRSKRLLIYGLLGGVVGGLLGGLLFDPIDQLLLGPDKPSAHWSRLVGLAVIGAGVGAMIGIVELLARDAWLRMTQGPLAGKEFLIFKDLMKVGSSPRSDIYLFNDPLVAAEHAVLRAVGDECEIEARQTSHPLLLNDRTVNRARLRHGDTVTVGRTVFVFQRRRG
jgi:hypothetical protein